MPILKFLIQLKIYNKIENSISKRILIILNKFKRMDCVKCQVFTFKENGLKKMIRIRNQWDLGIIYKGDLKYALKKQEFFLNLK